MDWQGIGAEIAGFAQSIWLAISSPTAQRLYVVALAIAAVGLALIRARSRKHFLENVTAGYFEKRYRGRWPTREESRKRREDEMDAFKKGRARGIWLAMGELFALGVIFPATLLALGTLYYGWFDASAAPLLDDRSGVAVRDPSLWQIAAYVGDHMLRGGLFDLMEVFKLHASTVTNNRDAYGYTVGLFLFHVYVEAFFLFGLIAVGRMALLVPRALRGL